MTYEALAPGSLVKPALTSGRNVHLDAMRGLAAVSVVCTHTRGVFFVPYHQAGSGLLVNILYIDHYVVRASVIFFFVLSGYLVGMSVVKSIEAGRWSWRDYLVSRLTRLYVVLLPALALTAILDWIERATPASRWAYYNVPIEAEYTTAYFETVRNLIGSLLFLQNIHTGWFGSNSALWSLSCEFWYYILFPVIALALLQRKRWLTTALFVAGISWFLGFGTMALFPCWLAGVAVGLIARRRLLDRPLVRRSVVAASILFLIGIVLASGVHRVKGLAADYLITVVAMAMIWAALSSPGAGRAYSRGAVFLSEMSYSLYLTHLPLLLLIERLWLREHLWPADLRHVLLAMTPLSATLIFAYGMYWLFESRTDRVRRFVKGQLARLDGKGVLVAAKVP